MPIPHRPAGLPPVATLPPGYRLGPITADLGDIPWGRVDEHRVEWHLIDLDGWWDAADVAGTVTDKPYGHGAWLGPAWYGVRIVTIDGLIVAPSAAARDAALARLSAACPLTPTAVLRVDSHPASQAIVRRTGQYRVNKPALQRAEVQVQLLAPDPLRYATEATVLWLPTAGAAGLAPPVTPPAVLPAVDPLTRLVFNGGDIACGWQAAIGPSSSPRLSNHTTGQVLGFDVDIPAGASLLIDTAAGTATVGGADVTASISAGTGMWLLARGHNLLSLSCTPPGATAARFSFRSAWS